MAEPTRQGAADIARLLRARSVAIVGASQTPGALGTSVLANLERMQFGGDIHLVNPNREEIRGRRCLKSINDLPLGVDAAVLAIPRAAVLDSIRALALREVGSAVIFASGFAEGGEQGLQEQRAIAEVAAISGMVIEGPNCLGFVNHVDGIALTFVETPSVSLGDQPGIGIVSQSGAMAAVVSVMLTSRALGISYTVSTGNEAVTGVEEFFEFVVEDPRTNVIGLIVEQFRKPRRFLELAAHARELGKAVILLHPGRSSAARESAATHTGALAGDYALMLAKVKRQGIRVAESLEEFGDMLELAARCPRLPSGGVVYVTESGAFKALTLDLCEQLNLSLPPISDQSAPLLRAAIPDFVPVSNPLDLTAQALVDPDLYRRTLAALVGDDRFGSIVLGIIQTDAATSDLKLPHIINALGALESNKPVVFAGLDEGAEVPAHYIQQLRKLGVPYFPSPDRALRAIARLATPALPSKARSVDVPREPISILESGVVPEWRAKEILASAGIPFPKGFFVHSLDEALSTARAIGFPVALKAQSPHLSHKSDAGGVVLALGDEAALTAGWSRLHASIAANCPGITLDGVLVEAMGARGIELIVGARNDPAWGVVVLAGFGGVQAEILKDVRLFVPDMSTEEIILELGMLKSAPLLRGFRGSPPLDVAAVAAIISQLGSWLQCQPTVLEIDLNPVVVYPVGDGVIALDALMQVGTPAS